MPKRLQATTSDVQQRRKYNRSFFCLSKSYIRPIVSGEEVKNLPRIIARTPQNDVLWKFFGIHTAKLARRAQQIKAKQLKKVS